MEIRKDGEDRWLLEVEPGMVELFTGPRAFERACDYADWYKRERDEGSDERRD